MIRTVAGARCRDAPAGWFVGARAYPEGRSREQGSRAVVGVIRGNRRLLRGCVAPLAGRSRRWRAILATTCAGEVQ